MKSNPADFSNLAEASFKLLITLFSAHMYMICIYIYMYMYMHGKTCMQQHTHGGQRITIRNGFSLFTMWVPGI